MKYLILSVLLAGLNVSAAEISVPPIGLLQSQFASGSPSFTDFVPSHYSCLKVFLSGQSGNSRTLIATHSGEIFNFDLTGKNSTGTPAEEQLQLVQTAQGLEGKDHEEHFIVRHTLNYDLVTEFAIGSAMASPKVEGYIYCKLL
jgi:hypothetical protein